MCGDYLTTRVYHESIHIVLNYMLSHVMLVGILQLNVIE